MATGIPDYALLRAVAEDVPEMALSVREHLREIADMLEGKAGSPPAHYNAMRDEFLNAASAASPQAAAAGNSARQSEQNALQALQPNEGVSAASPQGSATASERAKFEQAMARCGYELNPQTFRDGTYRNTAYIAGWEMWQATRGTPETPKGSI